jgi:metacaspase-1
LSTTSYAKTKRRNVRRKALICGINEYQNPNNNLSGCVNDAKDVASTLQILGFPPTKMRLLLNEQASTEGILKGLDWLVKDAVAGDVLIFYYSGHGSQVADLDDNEELDRYDEIICPWDISWRDNKYVTDDQLYDYFTKKLPVGVRTDVILDSCFSGTATRSLGTDAAWANTYTSGTPSSSGWTAVKTITGTKTQRFLPPPVDHQFRLSRMNRPFTDHSRVGKSVVYVPEQVGSIDDRDGERAQHNSLWAACQEYQVAWEMQLGSEVRGAFTYYFTRILRKSNGDISRGDLYPILSSSMYEDGMEQIPYLEAPNEGALGLFPFRKEKEVDRPSEVKVKQ